MDGSCRQVWSCIQILDIIPRGAVLGKPHQRRVPNLRRSAPDGIYFPTSSKRPVTRPLFNWNRPRRAFSLVLHQVGRDSERTRRMSSRTLLTCLTICLGISIASAATRTWVPLALKDAPCDGCSWLWRRSINNLSRSTGGALLLWHNTDKLVLYLCLTHSRPKSAMCAADTMSRPKKYGIRSHRIA